MVDHKDGVDNFGAEMVKFREEMETMGQRRRVFDHGMQLGIL